MTPQQREAQAHVEILRGLLADGECNTLTRTEADAIQAAITALLPHDGAGEWQPIETCPRYKKVMLWIPEHEGWGWAAGEWRGMRSGGDSRNHGYDERIDVDTPYRHPDGRMITCPIKHGTATHWRPLAAAPHAGGEG